VCSAAAVLTCVPGRGELDGYFQTYMAEIGKKGDRFFNGIALVPAAKGLEGLRRRFS